jgi:sigma-B regulation protein RsbU (phosphoserine phosphatase)
VDVGGDYYDVFRISGRWWLALGDVCGKGPAAAALTTAVRYSLRALTLEDADPVSVLARLNEVLLAGEPDASLETRFTTIVLVALRPVAGGLELEVASAGHPPPLLRRGCGAVQAIPVSGMPVGLFPDLVLGAVRLRLEPGDALLLYTDGATEARGQDGDELGEGALRELLESVDVADDGTGPSARDLVDTVLDGVLRHASVLRDDLALVALVAGEPG